MVASKKQQFLLLFWKNWIIQKRKLSCTIFELSLPVLMALLLLSVRQLIESTDRSKLIWPSFQVNDLNMSAGPTWVLAYTPSNNIIDGIMQSVVEQLAPGNQTFSFSTQGNYARITSYTVTENNIS